MSQIGLNTTSQVSMLTSPRPMPMNEVEAAAKFWPNQFGSLATTGIVAFSERWTSIVESDASALRDLRCAALAAR